MTVGQTHQLGKIVGPSDAKVHWNVANDNIATIDQTGKITALAPGSTAVWIEVSKFEVTETAAFTLTVESLNITNRPANNTLIVGQTHTVSKNPSNASITWKSSEPNIATIDQNGKITAKLAGTTKISAISGNKSVSFDLNVTRTITGDDVYITDQTTKDSIILYKNLVDAVELAYLSGKISQEEKELHQSSLNNSADIARADYVILNPESNFAYQYFKNRNYKEGDISPFKRDLTYNSEEPQTGLDIIIVQRTLELLGFFEPYNGYLYGTYDEATQSALEISPYYKDSTNSFDATCYRAMFSASTASKRSPRNIEILKKLRDIHNEVAKNVAKKVGGRSKKTTVWGAGEKKIRGYADVIKDGTYYTYIWEVKPWDDKYRNLDGIGQSQLDGYITAWNTNDLNKIKYKEWKPATHGYYIGKFAFEYKQEMIIVESNPATDSRAGLVHYKNMSRDEYEMAYAYEYTTEEATSQVPEPDYSFGYSLHYNSCEITGLSYVAGAVMLAVVIGGITYFMLSSSALGLGGLLLGL